jgi:glycine dehydrogenase subunit 1
VLKATVYMALVGPKGLCDIALLSAQKAHQLAQALTSLSGVSLRYPQHPFWTEFVLQIETIPVNVLLSRLQQYNIIGGISLSDSELLVTATELTTTDQVMAYQTALAQCLNTDGGI